MTNYAVGHQAEQLAAEYLVQQGFEVLELNWKTTRCEIDVVAIKNNRVYLVEVKYRKNNAQGSGLDYITTKKLTQMRFAAEIWVQMHNWRGDYTLTAIELSGPHFVASNLVEL